jgi:hypothetical protein
VEELTVSTRLVARIVEVAKARGLDPDALCREVGFDPSVLADVEGWISGELYFRTWATAVEHARDRAFPLHVARNSSGVHNLIRFVCKASDTLGTALERACRFLPSMSRTTQWHSTPLEGGAVEVAIERKVARPVAGTDLADEYCIAEIVYFGRCCAQNDWAPTSVTYAHAEPRDSIEMRAFLRSPLRYDAQRTTITLPAEVLALPFVEPDAAATEFFERMLASRLPSTAPAAAPVVVDAEGHWLMTSDGRRTSLARKATLRRLLRRLVDARFATPSQVVRSDELIELGWPGERVAHDAAMNRLRVAMARLRQAGLEAMLVSERGGYWLDPKLPLDRR